MHLVGRAEGVGRLHCFQPGADDASYRVCTPMHRGKEDSGSGEAPLLSIDGLLKIDVADHHPGFVQGDHFGLDPL